MPDHLILFSRAIACLSAIIVVVFLVSRVCGNVIVQENKESENNNGGEVSNRVPAESFVEEINAVYPEELSFKLERLTPEEPGQYFLAGEDAMDLGYNNLARKLFVFAACLDSETYGRSSCLALADIAESEGKMREAARLQGSARMYPGINIQPVIETNVEDRKLLKKAARNISAMLGYYRHGEGAYALKALAFDEVTQQLINQYPGSLSMLSAVINKSRNYPRCPECHNEGVVKCPACRGGADPGRCAVCNNHYFILCRTCQGKPGPFISTAELDSMLRIEVALLSGKDASWAAQLELDSGMPGSVIDPTQLAYSFDIDLTRMRYRQGKWYQFEDMEQSDSRSDTDEDISDN